MQPDSFDTYAARYDADFTFSPVGKLQRKRVHHFLQPYLKQHQQVLEINCGTGEDARWMKDHTKQVTATDISVGMIEACRQKNIEDVAFEVCDMRQVGNRFCAHRFDILFSNFGGLNCLSPEEIKAFSVSAASCLSPDGLLVAVVMGRQCKWERFYFKRKKDERQHRRQSRGGVPAMIDAATFCTWYYSPHEFAALCSGSFRQLDCRPIGLFVPPSYLNPYFKNKKTVLQVLYLLERMMPFSSMSDKADHYLIVLQKKEVA